MKRPLWMLALSMFLPTLACGGDAAGPEDAQTVRDAQGSALPDAASPDVTIAVDAVNTDATCSGWTTLIRLSPAQLASLMATSDPVVINVHVPYAGDIPGTDTSIPFTDVDAIEATLHHDHCADVVLVCLAGSMSLAAGNELVKRGYQRVRDLSGGMQAWQDAGYPLLEDGGT